MTPPTKLRGKRVVITGASGLVALPVAVELAKDNEVYAVARYSDPKQKRLLDEAGCRTITFDMVEQDLSPLPKSADIVINYGVLPPNHPQAFEVNTGGTGRLASRYRDCEAFIHGSTASVYSYQGERPIKEEDAYGLHMGTEPYSASKIGAEYMLKQLSIEWNMPTVMLRIFSFYGPRGGGPTERIYKIAHGQPVSIHPGVRNVYNPMYEDDYVEKTIQCAFIAKAPAVILNVGGCEAVTIQDYCEMAGEMLGKKPVYVEDGRATPIWADLTRMIELLGPSKISMREGVRRIIEGGVKAPLTAHAAVGQPVSE
jgi:nucleoside-diphosphate-sugar epimerase